MDPFEAITIIVLAGLAAFVQSVSGFGFSLFLVPPLAMLIGPVQAVVVSNALGLFNNGYTIATSRGHVDRKFFVILAAASAVGMPVGLAVLRAVEAETIKIIIAIVVLVSTALIWRGFRITRQSLALDLVTGFTSGVLNTTTSMSGPPVVLYMQGKGMAPEPFRATIACFFIVTSLIAVALFALDGRVDGTTGARAAVAVPGIVTGWFFGNKVFRRLGPQRFRSIVIGVLILSAVIALATTLF